jgi:hypothetical protein
VRVGDGYHWETINIFIIKVKTIIRPAFIADVGQVGVKGHAFSPPDLLFQTVAGPRGQNIVAPLAKEVAIRVYMPRAPRQPLFGGLHTFLLSLIFCSEILNSIRLCKQWSIWAGGVKPFEKVLNTLLRKSETISARGSFLHLSTKNV